MSTSSIKGGLGSFFSALRIKDPVRRGIIDSTTLIDRMLKTLESSRRSLESLAEEYNRRAKAPGQDSEVSKIIEDEVKNIYGYLSLITKTIHDLTRVKYRLETLFYIEEPLKVIPEILAELKSIEPELEKINPQLLAHIKMLEQRVTSILAITSPSTITSTPLQLAQSTGVEISEREPLRSGELKTQTARAVTISASKETATAVKQAYKSPSTPEKSPTTETPLQVHVAEKQPLNTSDSLPLHIIEEWILNELKVTAGILDIGVFEKKYGIPRSRILEALSSLETRGLVKIRRK
jgi:sugar-specific transcriptional regulator TrmB